MSRYRDWENLQNIGSDGIEKFAPWVEGTFGYLRALSGLAESELSEAEFCSGIRFYSFFLASHV